VNGAWTDNHQKPMIFFSQYPVDSTSSGKDGIMGSRTYCKLLLQPARFYQRSIAFNAQIICWFHFFLPLIKIDVITTLIQE
jgi:hypothetical protein